MSGLTEEQRRAVLDAVLKSRLPDLPKSDAGIFSDHSPLESMHERISILQSLPPDIDFSDDDLFDLIVDELPDLAESRLAEIEQIAQEIHCTHLVDHETWASQYLDCLEISEVDRHRLWQAFLDNRPPSGEPCRLSLDAPPIAWDAEACLAHIERLRLALQRGEPNKIVLHAIYVGKMACRLEVRPLETAAKQGRLLAEARRSGGKNSAHATAHEKELIVGARDKLARSKDWPKSKAARKIAASLRTGTFPGIDRRIDYSDKYVANLRAER